MSLFFYFCFIIECEFVYIVFLYHCTSKEVPMRTKQLCFFLFFVLTIESTFIVAPMYCGSFVFGLCFCYAVLGVISNFVIVLMGRESDMIYFNCLSEVLWLLVGYCCAVDLPGV